jgi:hypothetical protein
MNTTPTPSILVSYDHEPVALVNRRHTTLVGHVAQMPAGHPLLRMTTWMALYAKLVTARRLPGPYTDQDAERFARAALIDPAEFAQHVGETNDQLATRFTVPEKQIVQLRAERRDHIRMTNKHAINADHDLTQQARAAILAVVRTEHDFAGWLANVLARVAADLGSSDALTANRPGSWEAELVQRLVKGTTGWEDEFLADFKASPR